MAEAKTRILVVEDDTAILGGLVDLLVFHGYEVEGVEDGEIGLERALEGCFELVLLDVMLPGMDGFSVCEALRKRRPSQAVLMLTAKGSEEDVVRGLKTGADDYVTKPFSIGELLARVEALLRRTGKPGGQERLALGGVVFDSAALTASEGANCVDLTRREMDIILHLHAKAPAIVSRQELLAQVWGYGDADIETRTVDSHVVKLRRKLEQLDSAMQFIVTVRGEGYRLAPELLSEG
ncbi:response regulator transcription factor [Oceanidesulfovibrio marinus]|uniref:DNA-binding response regulator n=1 Tax=Oceanidesulfovibrio marinus TaxID=370038 RepID=A0A6P1ZGI1_9BACT|nr:response regulator transcription factor [Oceanidesulfovibrio marinus]QJT10658.1 response regulator transcription factor [Oceanidesulfovibrio marinus]TVM34114.1 DNA-binding response regulator [Oceanidesulfovibrio marinus]